MQPYRIARPHEAAECRQCSPAGSGHQLCQADGCQEIASSQTVRHATLAEYMDLPDSMRPIDGVVRRTVYGCDDHAEDSFDPFCDHTPTPAPPCPTCGANGDAPCTKKDRTTVRPGPHANREQPSADTCAHAHSETCGVFAGCQCTGQDAAPARPARPLGAAAGPDTSGLTDPAMTAMMLAAQNGVLWAHVVSARSMLTQDNRKAIAYEVRQYDETGNLMRDEHGHEIHETAVIPVPQA